MKFYITEETKQEIEAKIEQLKKPAPHWNGIYVSEKTEERIELYQEILSSATILPVEENWREFYGVVNNTDNTAIYKNGVIIQPKQ